MSDYSTRCRQAVILAGGMGTRLAASTGGLPKALVPVGGRPILDRQMTLAKSFGIDRFLLLLGFGADRIIEWIVSEDRPGLEVEWSVEHEPLGNGGALLDVIDRLDSRFLVFFADQVMEFDIGRFVDNHIARGNDVTVVVHPNDHPHDSDLLEVDLTGRVTTLHRPPHPIESPRRNIVNAATYVFERNSLEAVLERPIVKADLGRDLLPRMILSGLHVAAYRSREYLKDMGTPERLAKVENDLTCGTVSRRLSSNQMPAILLDRDGTINVEVGRISRPEDIELIPGVGPALKKSHDAGYLTAIITNQPVVARGDCTFKQLDTIHARLEMLLAESRAYVDGIYVCPHHPDSGFPGEVASLKGPCRCRKPATGLIDEAASDLNLDLTRSWLIGDTTSDMECAASAGLFSALVATGHAGADARFDTSRALRFPDAPAAIDFIADEFLSLWRRCDEIASSAPAGSTISVQGRIEVRALNAAKLVAEALRRQGRPHVLTLGSAIVTFEADDSPIRVIASADPRSSDTINLTLVSGGSS